MQRIPVVDEVESSGEKRAADFVCELLQVQPELRSFIGHLLPAVDARADVLQEVNLVLWKKRDDFEPGTSFRNWAYTCARYVVMNSQKRARRDKRLVFGDELLERLAEEFEEADPRIEERLPALRRCLERVPEEDRTLLLERYAQHGAVKERADRSGRSAASLRAMLFRLRIALRRCIESELRTSPFSQ
ncbi:RNA polymerase sigma-70 factor (ECF subfamily) [Haloferula luteola]|uniref:RNA polymerase sigma-70 factor (ECF subfamily) n=1 Tax=Haloferula luteola TaxID=595692 RepID=A0A840V6P1_9BACT|nr:sigma-70 family RNA polymerase sigma factor [Haloferula luteola]MBB5353927.1 RNA polymerase sigma-70 factor (ECF subfamily) [Haloferula luteola]